MSDKQPTKTRLHQLTEQEEKFLHLLRQEGSRIKERFPLVYALAATVGVVSVLSGFNKIIDRIEFFHDYPVVLIGIGLVILTLTGAIYKKLG